MRRTLWVLAMLLLFLRAPAFALDPAIPGTLQNAAAATGDGTPLLVSGFGSVGVQVVLTDAEVTFEATIDGTNWAAVLCSLSTDGSTAITANATGLYQCPVAGFNQFRARVSTFGSGTVTVKALATTAKLGGGGGGGGLGAESDTLDTVFDRGKVIDGATSLANAVRFGGDATAKQWCGYHDASAGLQFRPCTDSNVRTVIPTNFTGGVYDEEGAADMEVFNPDGATPHDIWSYPNAAYQPKKEIWIPAGALSTDGTQCAAPAEVTINSGAKRYTILCADNDGSTAYADVMMPNAWNGSTVTLTGVFVQTAADTSNVNADVAMACRADGGTINNTWGTEVAMDTAMTGSNALDTVTTAAITPNGTCTGDNTMLQIRWQLDAGGTTTAVATMHLLGFKLTYSEDSRSS